MQQFPAEAIFKYDWRKYQHRVLEELEKHLSNNHLHVIAPPGSGKTVLGLEVARRLNKPSLIIAPTLAIRNQWIDRFCDLFLQTSNCPDWISKDIRQPKFMTVITYQALHAACCNQNESTSEETENTDAEPETEKPEEETITKKPEGRLSKAATEKIIAGLKNIGVETLVLDEAHHLKNEWWKSLIKVKNTLKATVVALTATPPYDVSASEWSRYTELNGPVDAEISVPELVAEGNLCPHQDYVYFSTPTLAEAEKIYTFKSKISKFFEDIKQDETLKKALKNHPAYKEPFTNSDWIFNNIEFFSSILIFLAACNEQIPEEHFDILGNKEFKIPELDYEWLEILLSFYLYKDTENLKEFEGHRHQLESKLKHLGILERKQLKLVNNRRINNLLSTSLSKLNSIVEIVNLEFNNLKEKLRMVILTDYIRREVLSDANASEDDLNKIGVIPVFEKIRRNSTDIKLGVLTGSIVIIPRNSLAELEKIASRFNYNNITYSPYTFDNNYLVINIDTRLRHDFVHIVTQLFESGGIEVLVGTKALLGEGWDAPSINSLILASFVGSYVLSNQMRGRAIRSERGNDHKTANIWHLVCIDNFCKNGGEDISMLTRRFKAFVGLSFYEIPTIENGIGRLQIPAAPFNDAVLQAQNLRMAETSSQRENLKQKWANAINNGKILVEEIRIAYPKTDNYWDTRTLYYNKTIKFFLIDVGIAIIYFSEKMLELLGRNIRHVRSKEDLILFFNLFLVLLFGIFSSSLYKGLKMYVKYRDIAKDIENICRALVDSLSASGSFETEKSKLEVSAVVDKFGAIYCHLEGGSKYDCSLFLKSLQEILSPIESPRYIISRKNIFMNHFKQVDYHAVPETIGKKKGLAEQFKNLWRLYVGDCELIYTRDIEGRKILLNSRLNTLSSEFQDKYERVCRWR